MRARLVATRRASSTRPHFGLDRCHQRTVLSESGGDVMDVRPLHDRIIVRRHEEGEQQSGGIIIPDTAKEKPQRGTVIAAGTGTIRDGGRRIPLDVKAGDVILFGKYTSQEVKLDGEEFLVMREDEVLAIIETG